MDVKNIRTEQDLVLYLEQQEVKLEELRTELAARRAESATRRMELAEGKIQRLAEAGMSYDKALDVVAGELEEEDSKIQAEVDKERSQRVLAKLEEMSEREQMRLMEEG